MATSVNITYGKLYTIGKSKLCWFQMCANGVGRQSGRKDMSKTKVALNPRLRLQIFHVTVKRPSKVGQRKVRSLVRNRNHPLLKEKACFNKWMWYTMKLLGKWYKCQAEQTKNELRGDFDLSRRENPGKTMMPIHWLCADPTKLIIKASLSAPT